MIGILGKGQLSDMLEVAANTLGKTCRFYQPGVDALDTLQQFIAACDVITYENENIPMMIAQPVDHAGMLKPSLKALQISSNRFLEKSCFEELGISTANFCLVRTAAELEYAMETLGFPIFFKTTTGGYDGKGQRRVCSRAELVAAPLDFTREWIAEKEVKFEAEISLVAARRSYGDTVYYPLAHNRHESGILRETTVLAVSPYAHLEKTARLAMDKLMAHFEHIGVLTIEFFVTAQGDLVANECAPRVHNSGHWSIEGAETSQFENHIRAILGMPLGSTDMRFEAVGMCNIIGTFPDVISAPVGTYHWHDYHKAPRENRKLGHVTVTAPDAAMLSEAMRVLSAWIQHESNC